MTKLLFYALLCVAVVIGGCVWEVSVWKECRKTNSVSYCIRVMMK